MKRVKLLTGTKCTDLKMHENINKMNQNTRKVTQDDSSHPTFETNTNKFRSAGRSRKKESMGEQLSADQ